MNQELEEKLASLVEQQTLNTSKHTIEKVLFHFLIKAIQRYCQLAFKLHIL